jgi:hypothetical protein
MFPVKGLFNIVDIFTATVAQKSDLSSHFKYLFFTHFAVPIHDHLHLEMFCILVSLDFKLVFSPIQLLFHNFVSLKRVAFLNFRLRFSFCIARVFFLFRQIGSFEKFIFFRSFEHKPSFVPISQQKLHAHF